MLIRSFSKISFPLAFTIFLAEITAAQPAALPDLHHPPAVASLFGTEIISTNLYERDMALSPDGQEIFYTLQSPQGVFSTIMYMRRTSSGAWSSPEVASFSGQFSDMEPAFASDGRTLFFVSNRPIRGDSLKDFDIWTIQKKDGSWESPKNLGSPVNTSENEFYPSLASNGNMYFTANYSKGKGKEDIYMAKWESDHYGEPFSLDEPVNSNLYEFNAFIDLDEKFIIFTSYGRKDDKGRGDLYISFKGPGGKWQEAMNLGSVNSEKLDYCPFVSFDKKIFFFTSEKSTLKDKFGGHPATLKALSDSYHGIMNGQGNIYWISMDELLKNAPKN